ncbi:Nucleoporin [Wickerhamomyces ciferrii]|uniref:Nuclear pore complex protein Nup85 n=1 Tax=Wickerhamomyces ciferrii (strain ATCC 14091 / BCRC 22168 / CBS 111 / JCM 3599 / NBRC 0793 / NRRL Y-1031 F-60-10) TaxID=1206466 RepID=K0KER5_WICCF|nr:Nucleoporin [Wickerhamomyces ciferrii]CCH43625.1 Nucleoporin [Wickerhamomyces ciferrii]
MAFQIHQDMAQDKEIKDMELMDETFDFVDDDDQELEDEGLDQELDPVSGVLLERFPEAPIPNDEVENWRNTSRILKYKLNPNGINGVGFISQDPTSDKEIKVFPQETKLYPISIPQSDDSDAYTEYISSLYSIYEALGDERYYSVATIGLIKKNAQHEQAEVLNNAFSLTIQELELYIEHKQAQQDSDASIFELEECLYILNALKAVFFANDQDVPQLLSHWINRADPQPSIELNEAVMKSEKPYQHPYFWKFINQLVLRGLYSNAAEALKHSEYKELNSIDLNLFNLFTDAENLLSNYPIQSTPEVFKEWKKAANTASSNASIRNKVSENNELYKGIKTLLSIISGNKSIIFETSETWYESLVALIYYHIPSISLLSEYFTESLQHHQPDRTVVWEVASVDIFEGNFIQVLRSLSSFNSATAAYTSALLEAKGLLKGYSLDEDENGKIIGQNSLLDQEDLFSTRNVSEFLLHGHALDCLSIEKLIPVGIGLLALSRNPTARSVIAEYLPKYNFKTNDDIEWALTICASLKLPTIAHVLFRTAAQRALNLGLVLEALTLFARAGDIEYVKHHTWFIFEKSLILGKPIDDLIINAVIDDSIIIEDIDPESLKLSPILRQLLSPYAILYQFWKFKESGSLKQAITRLISLLKFPHLPPNLFGLLISQFLPFIIFLTPPKILTKQELLSVVKILDQFDNNFINKKHGNSKILEQANKLYKISIDEDKLQSKPDNYWVKQLKESEITPPTDFQNLLILVRRNIAVEIGRSFLEERYN